MKLENHIAYLLLINNELAKKITLSLSPKGENPTEQELGQAASTYTLVNNENQKSYYITNTVIDKLDMLKVARKNDLLDWGVFANKIKDGKTTYILPSGMAIRMRAYNNTKLGFCLIWKERRVVEDYDSHSIVGDYVSYSTFFLDRLTNTLSDNWVSTPQIIANEGLIYKLLCFIYLSENTEQIIPAGGKHGTKKQGKIINSLPFPVTIVTSKWAITSIRTEGFDVSGHFRLQPTNTGVHMIFIAPFRKHGYVRGAKSKEEI